MEIATDEVERLNLFDDVCQRYVNHVVVVTNVGSHDSSFKVRLGYYTARSPRDFRVYLSLS